MTEAKLTDKQQEEYYEIRSFVDALYVGEELSATDLLVSYRIGFDGDSTDSDDVNDFLKEKVNLISQTPLTTYEIDKLYGIVKTEFSITSIDNLIPAAVIVPFYSGKEIDVDFVVAGDTYPHSLTNIHAIIKDKTGKVIHKDPSEIQLTQLVDAHINANNRYKTSLQCIPFEIKNEEERKNYIDLIKTKISSNLTSNTISSDKFVDLILNRQPVLGVIGNLTKNNFEDMLTDLQELLIAGRAIDDQTYVKGLIEDIDLKQMLAEPLQDEDEDHKYTFKINTSIIFDNLKEIDGLSILDLKGRNTLLIEYDGEAYNIAIDYSHGRSTLHSKKLSNNGVFEFEGTTFDSEAGCLEVVEMFFDGSIPMNSKHAEPSAPEPKPEEKKIIKYKP